MTKKLLSILLTLVMVLSIAPVAAFAEDDILSYLTYEITDGEVTITDCDDAVSGKVVIPDMIEGYPVTVIGDDAFSYCDNITEIIIPDSVTTIGDYAFFYCYMITDIIIPDSVTTIGDYAFCECYSIKEIIIPDSVTIIGDHTFSECMSITEIIIPDSVTTIGDNAFSGCNSISEITIPRSVTTIGNYVFQACNLTYITVDENNLYYSNDEYGVLFDKEKTTLVCFPGSNEAGTYEIPDSVTTIGDSAFYGCDNLTEITISDSVTTIGVDAFYGCRGITEITIPESVKEIGSDAFYYCENLENITIKDSVIAFGAGVFSDTAYFNNEQNWDNDALYIDGHLLSVKHTVSGSYEVKEGTKVIAAGVFARCSNLIDIALPDGLISIGERAFFQCLSLKNINLPESLISIGYQVFANCVSLENINLPESLTTIGSGAFAYCISLEKIDLPESLTVIDDEAFAYCMSLEDLIVHANIQSVGAGAFGACHSLGDIYVYNPEIELEETSFGYLEFDVLFDNKEFADLYKKFILIGLGIVSVTEEENAELTEKLYASINMDSTEEFQLQPMKNFTIHGYIDSTSETYANENGFNFVALDACEHNYVDTVITPATYTQPGVGGKVCEHCEDVLETYEIPMLEIEDSEEKEDADTGVSVIFPEGTFEGEAEIEVTPVEEGEAYKLISHKQGNYKVTMFDINVTVDGENVQPNGIVLVKIPLPKGYNQNKCVVYYVADDGTMEELKTYHFKDGYVHFETDHFSYYAVLEEVETSSDNNNNDNNENVNPLRKLLNYFIDAFNKFIAFIKAIFGIA